MCLLGALLWCARWPPTIRAQCGKGVKMPLQLLLYSWNAFRHTHFLFFARWIPSVSFGGVRVFAFSYTKVCRVTLQVCCASFFKMQHHYKRCCCNFIESSWFDFILLLKNVLFHLLKVAASPRCIILLRNFLLRLIHFRYANINNSRQFNPIQASPLLFALHNATQLAAALPGQRLELIDCLLKYCRCCCCCYCCLMCSSFIFFSLDATYKFNIICWSC